MILHQRNAFPPLKEQMDVIKSFVAEVFPEDLLAEKIERSIRNNKPLNIKLGCDPSKPDLHIGHAVVLRKLRQFQDLGHIAILIIGDFTAMIGDPSGKNKTRPPLSLEETRLNGQTYLEQATKILSSERLILKYNSEWLEKMNFADVIQLSSKYTVSQMLERDDFHKRFNQELPIGIHEFLYPLAQAMDSVIIKADVELGGTDQKFNLIVGREIQKGFGLEPQCIVLLPILEGTDGKDKMSKSLGNYIALTDPPNEMYGKIMSIPDGLMIKYLKYAVFADEKEVNQIDQDLKFGRLHPRNVKIDIAKRVVKLYYNEKIAEEAYQEFEKIFVKKDIPSHIDTSVLEVAEKRLNLIDLLVQTGLAPSKKEGKRLVEQGGVYVDGKRVLDVNLVLDLSQKRLLKYGKRKFLYVISA